MAKWYEAHLGINPVPTGYDSPVWVQQDGPTIFGPFEETSDGSGKGWTINFRVSDLEKMVAQLKAASIEVEVDPATYPNGKFASLIDPEGNPIQLWEPQGVAANT